MLWRARGSSHTANLAVQKRVNAREGVMYARKSLLAITSSPDLTFLQTFYGKYLCDDFRCDFKLMISESEEMHIILIRAVRTARGFV